MRHLPQHLARYLACAPLFPLPLALTPLPCACPGGKVNKERPQPAVFRLDKVVPTGGQSIDQAQRKYADALVPQLPQVKGASLCSFSPPLHRVILTMPVFFKHSGALMGREAAGSSESKCRCTHACPPKAVVNRCRCDCTLLVAAAPVFRGVYAG